MKKHSVNPLRLAVHIGGWAPLARIIYGLYAGTLTVNPIQKIEQVTGLTALIFLVLSLACSPLSFITGWRKLIQRRKALGLYGFMYAALHVATFVVVDYALDFQSILRDVGTKPYIIVGALAFLLLLPVAATSFNYWQKRLGKTWKRLHRLVYVILPLAALHFALAVKGNLATLQGNIQQPFIFGFIVAALLVVRVPFVKRGVNRLRAWLAAQMATATPPAAPPPEGAYPPSRPRAGG
jgi:sulfoxide reductase heme-binding subunit YedZ